MMESERDQSRSFVHAEWQKLQNLQDWLKWGLFDDNLSLLGSSHEMFCYEVDQAFHDYLHPLFDAFRKRTATFSSL